MSKPTTDAAWPLDIRGLARAGYLTPGWHTITWPSSFGSPAAIMMLVAADGTGLTLVSAWPASFGAAASLVCEAVAFARSLTPFGGERRWFACPGCERRIAILYGYAGRFRCRTCHGLAYGSTREDATRRLLRKADRIRARLDGPPGLGRVPPKPKRMRRSTYQRLVREMQELDVAYVHGQLGRLGERVQRLQRQRSASSRNPEL